MLSFWLSNTLVKSLTYLCDTPIASGVPIVLFKTIKYVKYPNAFILMIRQRVPSSTTVSCNQKLVFICRVCHLKRRVFCVFFVPLEVFQVNSKYEIISDCQTMEIVVSKPELAVQIPKSVFVGFPAKVEVNRAVQTSLKNCPTSTVSGHVTHHLYWFAAIRIYCVHATGCETILKELGAVWNWLWGRR